MKDSSNMTFEQCAIRNLNQEIQPDHHLINLQYLVESGHPEMVGDYIEQRLIRPLLWGNNKESDVQMLSSVLDAVAERLSDVSGANVQGAISPSQLFVDVIRTVLDGMREQDKPTLQIDMDLGDLFPDDETAGHGMEVTFDLYRKKD